LKIFLKKINYLIVVFSLFFFVQVHAQDDSRVISLLAEADSFLAKNHLVEALAKTQEALYLSSANLPALQKRINIYYLMNNDKEAMFYADEAVQNYPNQPEFYYLRGIINNYREKYAKALDDFSKAIDLNDNNLYKDYLGRGVSHTNLLEYEQALSDFTRSIELNDTIASAYHSRALVNYEIRDYSSAVDDFLKALKYSSDNAALDFNLGMCYYRLNDMEKACPYFSKACTLGNKNACRMTLMECAKSIPNIK
jgi:tetratricopeptide (TPR) repeat protein